MPATTSTRYTVATVLDRILAIDRKHTKDQTVYSGDDFSRVSDLALMVSHLEGRPFQMAADLLGVSPALLSGVLEAGADRERDIALATPEGLERTALYEGAEALCAASAMYEAENAPEDIGPQTRNDRLAELLERITAGDQFGENDVAILAEAATRLRERGDEED